MLLLLWNVFEGCYNIMSWQRILELEDLNFRSREAFGLLNESLNDSHDLYFLG